MLIVLMSINGKNKIFKPCVYFIVISLPSKYVLIILEFGYDMQPIYEIYVRH
jgi:hypothetical protein